MIAIQDYMISIAFDVRRTGKYVGVRKDNFGKGIAVFSELNDFGNFSTERSKLLPNAEVQKNSRL